MNASVHSKPPWWSRLDALTRPRTPESLPAQLNRRRIYLLPSRFGLFFAALLVVMLIGALNYNNNPALLLALLLAGAAQTSLLFAHLQLSGLEIVAMEAEPVAAGTPLQLRMLARAKPGRERRGLVVDAGRGADVILSLRHGEGEATLSLPTIQRGWLQPPRLRISTMRPLGLVQAWAHVWSEAPLLVHPAREIDGPPLPTGSGQAMQARLHPGNGEVHHLRGYRPGDPRRAIAWKPSARRDTLLVREFEQPLDTDVDLDWSQLAGLDNEARIRRLARWVDLADRDNRRYRLHLPGQPALGPGRGNEHRLTCLRALALLPFAGERPS